MSFRNQYHTDSLTAFQNWPTQNTPLGHVTAVGWSPSSEYLAMGNGKGRVLLYRVKLYSGC
jgi:U3 small nucleolar RNA-associated protein 18